MWNKHALAAVIAGVFGILVKRAYKGVTHTKKEN